MDKPIVTVLIPNYNHGKYIGEAVNSVVEQTYKYKQICIIDDGSTDDSPEIIKKLFSEISYEKHDMDVCQIEGIIHGIQSTAILCSDNGKQAKARNLGIEATIEKTDFYALLDADDIYYPEKIYKCVCKFLVQPANIGIVTHDYDIFHESNGRKIRWYGEPYSRHKLLQECNIFSNSMVNKLAFIKVGLYDEELPPIEDYDMWIRITEKMMCIHIPEALGMYRVSGNQSTILTTNEFRREKFKILSKKTAERNG